MKVQGLGVNEPTALGGWGAAFLLLHKPHS